MKRLSLVLSIFLAVHLAHSQTPSDAHDRIRAAYDARNYRTAVAELRALEVGDPAAFRANNYDYLRARVAEKTGDWSLAMSDYHAIVSRESVLKPYALWHLSRIARASGNSLLERLHLQELISFAPESLLSNAASRRLAHSWFESGNYELAIRQIENSPKTPIGRSGTQSGIRERTAFMAEAHLRWGKIDKAKELFGSLITNLPNPAQPDDHALAAARALDQVGSAAAARETLSDYEHLRRASIYQFNRDFGRARIHYAAIMRDHPQSGLLPDAVFQTGRGYVAEGDFTEALKWLERVLEQFPEHLVAEEAVLQAASAYARLGKHHEAGVRYKKYIEKYPNGERLDRAYLNIVDVLRDEREETAALKWAETVRDKYRGKPQEALALFAKARIYLARTDWQNALSALEDLEKLQDLGDANTPGGATIQEIRFLRAYSLEHLRRYAEAIDSYLAIPDGRNEYYGWRSTERLRLMASDANTSAFVRAKAQALKEAKTSDPDTVRRVLQSAFRITAAPDEREKLLSSLRSMYAAIPAYSSFPRFKLLTPGRSKAIDRRTSAPPKISDELLFLGLYDEAAAELEVARSAGSGKTDLDYTIAVFHTRGNAAHRGVAFAESVWKLPADYQLELIPAEVSELLYPTPFAEDLMKHAPSRNVDPRFLLSIIRQESRYRPDVKSYAAARGLMQFISTTASRVSGELGRENFRQDDLYDPGTSILFGSHYTGNLFKLFPRQPAAVAASYNGGEDNMKRWLTRSKTEQMDGYVPEIAYAQSKDYAIRVMANYRVYQMLYDENLKRRPAGQF